MSALDTLLSHQKITHDLVQGTPEWLAFRLEHDGASEAAAMLGLSKKVTRSELLLAKHTGLPREFSDFVQKNILDKGHELEALARPHVEAQIGEDLYPVTCSLGRLSASCDGLTLDDHTAFEHKQWNEELAASVRAGIVPDEHLPQCQQITLVTGAKRVVFVVSDGTPEKMVSAVVLPDHAWWERIAAGWELFHADLASYTPPAAAAVVVAEPVQALPAVTVIVSGEIAIKDNFKAFETAVRDFLEHRLIREPKSDQDFADLDVQIKAMKGAEAALEAAEVQMLAQIQTVDSAKKTKDMLHKLVRENRLMAEALLKSEKERRRGEIVAGGISALREHLAALNTRIGKAYMPAIAADFAAAIKGRSSLAKMEDAVASELTRAKLEANRVADIIDTNLKMLREVAKDQAFLFADTAQLVLKDSEACRALAENRIAAHRAEEERKEAEQRERIRAEEQAKAEREARAKLEAEQAEAARRQREQEARDREAAEAAAQRQRDEEYVAGAEERERQRQAEIAGAVLVERAARAAQTPAAAPIAAPAPGSQAPNVVPLQQRAQPTAAATLSIGEINRRLNGYGLTAATLERLGFSGERLRGAVLFHEQDFPAMLDAMVADIRTVQTQHQQQAA